jgi:hypothetical protein
MALNIIKSHYFSNKTLYAESYLEFVYKVLTSLLTNNLEVITKNNLDYLSGTKILEKYENPLRDLLIEFSKYCKENISLNQYLGLIQTVHILIHKSENFYPNLKELTQFYKLDCKTICELINGEEDVDVLDIYNTLIYLVDNNLHTLYNSYKIGLSGIMYDQIGINLEKDKVIETLKTRLKKVDEQKRFLWATFVTARDGEKFYREQYDQLVIENKRLNLDLINKHHTSEQAIKDLLKDKEILEFNLKAFKTGNDTTLHEREHKINLLKDQLSELTTKIEIDKKYADKIVEVLKSDNIYLQQKNLEITTKFETLKRLAKNYVQAKLSKVPKDNKAKIQILESKLKQAHINNRRLKRTISDNQQIAGAKILSLEDVISNLNKSINEQALEHCQIVSSIQETPKDDYIEDVSKIINDYKEQLDIKNDDITLLRHEVSILTQAGEENNRIVDKLLVDLETISTQFTELRKSYDMLKEKYKMAEECDFQVIEH